MVEIIADRWICTDCLYFIANGDIPEDEDDAARVMAGCEREAPYHWALDGPHDAEHGPECDRCNGTGHVDRECPCEGACTFSWRACACCGSTLGGSRRRAALIGPNAPEVHS